MKSVFGRTGLRAIALAVGLLASSSTSQAANIVHYSTSGSIDSSGVSGTGVIGFDPVTDGSFESPSLLSLGEFRTPTQASGQTTTFSHTPFQIVFTATDLNGVALNNSSVKINGELNGSITGSTQANLLATFSPSGPLDFPVDNLTASLTVTNPKISLVPPKSNDGRTSAQAYLVLETPSVPEPTSISLFVVTLVGLGLRSRLRRR